MGASESENIPENPQGASRRPAFLAREWWTRKRIVVGAAVLAVALAAGIGVYAATAQTVPVDAGAPSSSQGRASSASAKEAVRSTIVLTIEAEGAEAGATKAKVLAVDGSNKVAVSEREVEANEPVGIGELPEGGYELHVTAAPVCEDGSSYKLPEKPVRFSVEGDGRDVPVKVKLEKLPADKMTKEQLEASAAALESAGKQEAASKAREASESAESRPGSESAIQNVPSTDGVSESNPDNGGSGSNSGSGGGSGSTGGNGGGTAPKPDPTPSAPSHTHSWVEQTTTVHHDAVYDTVHHDAVYDTIHHDAVTSPATICSGCGASFNDAASYMSHNKDGIRNGTACGTAGYYVSNIVIQPAWDEQVLVSAAWDEQVMISAAWDETVVTGYTCSCGQTK